MRPTAVSPMAIGTEISLRSWARACTASGRSGSSTQNGLYGVIASIIRFADGRFHSPWSSIIKSISIPTSSRMAAIIFTPSSSSCCEIELPIDFSAAVSKGQIFMPLMPLSLNSRASFAGVFKNAYKSSYVFSSASATPQFLGR